MSGNNELSSVSTSVTSQTYKSQGLFPAGERKSIRPPQRRYCRYVHRLTKFVWDPEKALSHEFPLAIGRIGVARTESIVEKVPGFSNNNAHLGMIALLSLFI